MTRCLLLFTILSWSALAQSPPAPVFVLSQGKNTSFTKTSLVTVTVVKPVANPALSWCVNASPTPPTVQECSGPANWSATVPASFTLSGGPGPNTAYLWYKDGEVISLPGQASITLVALLSPSESSLPDTLPTQVFNSDAGQLIRWSVMDPASPEVNLRFSCMNSSCPSALNQPNTGSYAWTPPRANVQGAILSLTNTDSGASKPPRLVSNPFNLQLPPLSVDCASCPSFSPGQPPFQYPTFTGFADPSIRYDQTLQKLWMGYSYSETHPIPGIDPKTQPPTEAIELHLSYSTDGGATWIFDKALWPSVPISTPDCLTCYTSNENITIWQDSGEWYGGRLTYDVPVGEDIYEELTETGSLVVTKADSPEDLPTSTVSHSFPFAELTSMANLPTGYCSAWYEPVVTVQSGTLFLIADCIPTNKAKNQYLYFIFGTTDLTTLNGWTLFPGGPFGGLKDSLKIDPADNATYLTEMDLFQRTDGSLVAVITPANLNSDLDTVHFGCRAIEFSLSTTGNYFGATLASLQDSGSDPSRGPGACTYDPNSVTGMVIVHKTTDPTIFTLLESGLMP